MEIDPNPEMWLRDDALYIAYAKTPSRRLGLETLWSTCRNNEVVYVKTVRATAISAGFRDVRVSLSPSFSARVSVFVLHTRSQFNSFHDGQLNIARKDFGARHRVLGVVQKCLPHFAPTHLHHQGTASLGKLMFTELAHDPL